MKKLLLIVLLILLPTIATAQEAWVLWNEMTAYPKDELPIQIYKMASAHPTYELCIKARDVSLQQDKAFLKNYSGPVRYTEECSIMQNWSTTFCYKCFPAGVDPRR